jgi:hypothetical protein
MYFPTICILTFTLIREEKDYSGDMDTRTSRPEQANSAYAVARSQPLTIASKDTLQTREDVER